MRRLLAPLAFLLLAPAAHAQGLMTGTWTGALAPARGANVPVEAALEECIGGYTVGLTVGGRAAGEAQEVRWAERRLRFRFVEPRSRRTYTCDLRHRDDGTLAGSCAVPRGRPAALTLSPPATGAFGCSG
jgi:hypothetical protein